MKPPGTANRMYDDLAWLWPLVSPPEEYEAEARDWRDALRGKLGPGRHEILELGVGGGHLLSHLTGDFRMTAVDVSEPMLAHSRRLNPGVSHHRGDMRSVRLGRTFDAVIIHDAIGYMLTESDLRAAFSTAAEHLSPGGIFITSPDHFRETFRDNEVRSSTHSDGRKELTFIEYSFDPDPGDTTVETVMFYLIRRNGRLCVEQDRHVMGLFPLETWLALMTEAGFHAEQHRCRPSEDPRQAVLLVGTLDTRG